MLSNGQLCSFRIDDVVISYDKEETKTVCDELAKEYRFGYQGSEEVDEWSGDGNHYTTFYRQLDPRLGRWMSIDPVVQPFQSPYTSMDNNPIKWNDILGNKIDPASEEEFKSLKGKTENKLKERKEEFEKLNSKINLLIEKGKEVNNELLKRQSYLSESIKELNETINEFSLMESNAIWTFSFERRSEPGGTTNYNSEEKKGKMQYQSDASGIHEASHGYGAISGDENEYSYTRDIWDEVKGHRRALAFDENHYTIYGANEFHEITPNWVKNRAVEYRNLAPFSLSIHTSVKTTIMIDKSIAKRLMLTYRVNTIRELEHKVGDKTNEQIFENK